MSPPLLVLLVEHQVGDEPTHTILATQRWLHARSARAETVVHIHAVLAVGHDAFP
jgi:hypothetical protein